MFNKLKEKRKYLKYVREFFIATVFPIFIAMFQSGMPAKYMSVEVRDTVTVLLAIFNLWLILHHFRRTQEEKDEMLTKYINGVAYTNAYQLSEKKRDYIVEKSYQKDYALTEEVIPYDIFTYIAEICKNFRDTISQITSVPQEHMAVTFIYHYDYRDATNSDRSWRWLVGKEFSTRTELDKFVERENSLYNYLINGEDGKVNSLFCNDKKQLAYEGHYYMSPRDKDHNNIGSVFAIKVMFGNNAGNFVEGILLVSSYGKRFVEKDSKYTAEELRNILFEELYPYYQRLLEAELGMLYLRHDKSEKDGDDNECKVNCKCHSCCRKTNVEDDEVA